MPPLFPDVNTSYRNYRDLGHTKVLVSRIFESVVGDGPFAGIPTVYIHMAGCNRGRKDNAGCSFCYADFKFADGIAMTYDNVMESIKVLRKARPPMPYPPLATTDKPLVYISGGEPMLQDNLTHLVTRLISDGYRVAIDTNGDIYPQGFFSAQECTRAYVVVSPRVLSDGKYIKLRAEWLDRADYFRVLLDADPKSPYHKVPEFLLNPAIRYKVFLAPITTGLEGHGPNGRADLDTPEQCWAYTLANCRYAALEAVHLGLRVSMPGRLLTGVRTDG